MSFENIVRPFANVDVTPIRVAKSAPQAPVSVRITPGLVGSTRTFQGSASHNTSYYMDTKHKEMQ